MWVTLTTLFLVFHLTTTACTSNNLEKLARQHSQQWGNPLGMSNKKICEIYSKASGRRVQIFGKRVNAKGDVGGKYAQLEISSRSFFGKITIKGVASGRYLCMNRKGKLFGKKGKVVRRCIFIEKLVENKFSAFVNARNPSWYIAFHRSGKPKRGGRTAKGQKQVMFLKFSHDEASSSTASPSGLDAKRWSTIEKRYLERQRSGLNPLVISHPQRLLKDDQTTVTVTAETLFVDNDRSELKMLGASKSPDTSDTPAPLSTAASPTPTTSSLPPNKLHSQKKKKRRDKKRGNKRKGKRRKNKTWKLEGKAVNSTKMRLSSKERLETNTKPTELRHFSASHKIRALNDRPKFPSHLRSARQRSHTKSRRHNGSNSKSHRTRQMTNVT